MSENFISLYQGDTWIIPVRLTNPDGTAFDLTGYTLAGYLLVGKTSTQATTSAQTATCLYSDGQAQFVISTTVTATILGDGPGASFFLTRFRIVTIDPAGNDVTRGVVNIRVLVP
ncbi:hypothetical protein [Beijerinckia sp. L45]|uniref:hypothetical protein n=1 Tax=Beijerinckia sp. L45 TaxID=1641855 RepID=UPI00131C85EA|nr:hypothetical protein [Beijerinckia sp. L45]